MAVVWRCVLVVLVVVFTCLFGYTEAVGGAKSRERPQRRLPKKPKVKPGVDELIPTQNINIQQMTGKWYLLNTASKCPYLINHGNKVEPTVMTLTQSSTADQTIAVSTKTRHNHQCWEILQVYHLTSTPGRLILKGAHPQMNTQIVITETDYTTFAIIYYQKYGKTTMKLYCRSPDDLSDPMLTKFEEYAEKQGFELAYLFAFPTYSHCHDTDQDHVINCVPTC